MEFVLCRGTVYTGHYEPTDVQKRLATPVSDVKALNLQIRSKGLLQTINWVPFVHEAALKDTEVVIEVKCSGMNFKDILEAMA